MTESKPNIITVEVENVKAIGESVVDLEKLCDSIGTLATVGIDVVVDPTDKNQLLVAIRTMAEIGKEYAKIIRAALPDMPWDLPW